ncbi:MAG TPA: hypothetical protein VGQ83_11180 [Polyangia bacterium]
MAEASLEGLWYIQAGDDPKVRTPVLAKVSDDTYMLAFSNAPKARSFIQRMNLTGADVGMVVRGNLEDVRSQLRSYGAIGVIIDYDPETHAFAAARAA